MQAMLSSSATGKEKRATTIYNIQSGIQSHKFMKMTLEIQIWITYSGYAFQGTNRTTELKQ
jgi:hypothetical protein